LGHALAGLPRNADQLRRFLRQAAVEQIEATATAAGPELKESSEQDDEDALANYSQIFTGLQCFEFFAGAKPALAEARMMTSLIDAVSPHLRGRAYGKRRDSGFSAEVADVLVGEGGSRSVLTLKASGLRFE
ncbi:unnamed protein product, partial [Symbiodinium pilosum]